MEKIKDEELRERIQTIVKVLLSEGIIKRAPESTREVVALMNFCKLKGHAQFNTTEIERVRLNW